METKFSYLKSQNAEYIEDLFAKYTAEPQSVDETWRYFFEGLELGLEVPELEGEEPNGHVGQVTSTETTASLNFEFKVFSLIEAYRKYGTYAATLSPLTGLHNRTNVLHEKLVSQFLSLNAYGLSDADLKTRSHLSAFIGLPAGATLNDVIAKLRATYCDTIGYEFGHIQNAEIQKWLYDRVEKTALKAQVTTEEKLKALEKLTQAETFERFLNTRYVAKKRFSVEGGDALIPMLDKMIQSASGLGGTDIVLGMAHRGRLNVLTNIFGKNFEYVFSEFGGKLAVTPEIGSGDVKYHMGYSADYATPSGSVHLSMSCNPSHLEFVNAVVEGMARAKLDYFSKNSDTEFKKVIPVLIHGDAAFAGQGVCYETIQMVTLPGYATGGTIHIIVNNQVGFTTSNFDARSTPYSSDVMKMLDCPIFHVNGDDADAVLAISKIAVEYRQKFNQDVMIDLVCYRKYGHNEGDEPGFTQPLMYKIIKDHPSPREVYAAKLIAEKITTAEGAQKLIDDMNALLTEKNELAKAGKVDKNHHVNVFGGLWNGFRFAKPEDFSKACKTAVPADVLREVGISLGKYPEGFSPHPKLSRLLEQRTGQVAAGEGIDWGTGEALAFGSLLLEGANVRVSGQDCERGTFSHRHAVLNDFNNGTKHIPLNHIKEKQGRLFIYNSFLSETAVLGFEFGYACANPNALVVWEAQFGDFGNGAQVIIDQFIASSETKWGRASGVTLLLPHGYEGQGPEHSSARLERFLQLCGENNMQICNLTTPAQIFHALRRQVRRDFRKPLVVMSPKSLLRLPEAVSKLTDFSDGAFQEVIDDPSRVKNPRKVILCSGKIYYELVKTREFKKMTDVALVRLEQFYPWPKSQLENALKNYSSAKEIMWVQEEPKNMGGWAFVSEYIQPSLGSSQKISYVGRPASAAPASGSDKIHEKEQHSILEEALK